VYEKSGQQADRLKGVPFIHGVIMSSLPVKESKLVLITERNQMEKRILHHQESILEKIGT
jgi:hypothetical protein